MSGVVAQNVGRPSGLIKATEGGGAWTLIETLTSDGSDDTLDFVNGAVVFDSTYPIYVVKFIGIHCQTDDTEFQFNMSIDTGSNYNVAKTSTYFAGSNTEGDSNVDQAYETANDLAEGTGYQHLANGLGTDNDQSASGTLYIFQPSDTTFIKHFLCRSQVHHKDDLTRDAFIAGYGNTTSAVDAISFKMSSGQIQGGKIKLYGIKDS